MKELICVCIIVTAILLFTVAILTMRETDKVLAEILLSLKTDEECETCRHCGTDWKICMNENSQHAGENRWKEKACPEWEERNE